MSCNELPVNHSSTFPNPCGLKKKLRKELKLKKLKLKLIRDKNYKSTAILNSYKNKLKIAEKLKNSTSDLYLKNKYENEIIKYKNKIENYNINVENSSQIRAEIQFTKELIKEENIFYYNGEIQILELPKEFYQYN